MIELLQQIPITLQIAFITATTTAVATLTGVFLTNKANTARLILQQENERVIKQNELMRDKLEELYLLSKKWITYMEITYLNYTRAMDGQFDEKTLLDIEIKRGNENTDDFSRIEMLIDLYFSNIKLAYDDAMKAREKASKFMLLYEGQCLEKNTDKKKFVEPFLKAQEEFSQESKRMIKVIAEQANNFSFVR